jgi:hypothetical protein
VSYTWAELLGDAVTEADEPERTGFFGRMRESLAKSRRALSAELASAAFDASDDEAWERLEEALIRSDVGVPATAELVRRLEARGLTGELDAALVEEVEDLFGEPPTLALDGKPSVILVVGVNGTGKTTTIGKLARKLSEHGRSVLVGAADTFRAAAEEQLEIWAERAGADFVGSPRGADPAAVAFDAVEAAKARGHDVTIVDTAGRTARDRGPHRGGAERDLARRRRDDRPERAPAGEAVRGGGGRHRRRAHEAGRKRSRRGRDRDRRRARAPGQARRRRRRGGRSPPVRRRRLRPRADRRLTNPSNEGYSSLHGRSRLRTL